MQIDYNKRIFGLDLMRAMAILLVVFSHVTWITPNAQGFIPDLMSIAGVIGVEIFFVLSGFLIGRIIYKFYVSDTFNFSSVFYFWVRRWFRTLPNYYLALIINICIALYIGTQLPSNLWQYVFFIQNFSQEIPLFFSESWSLSIEEFAYIIGPFLLYLSLFIKSNILKSRMFLWITLIVIIVFTITKLIYNINDDIKEIKFWNSNLKAIVIYRIDAIYYGVLAAYISIVKPKFWKHMKYIALIIGALIFLGLNAVIPLKHIFIETYTAFWNVWYLPINSVAIMFSLPFLSQMQSAPKLILKPITYISLISYAMYVLHYSIILQVLKYKLPTESLPKFDTLVYILVYLSLTILLSYVVYRFYEKPMTDLRDSSRVKRNFK
ncbi:hypothetical protein A9Q87_07895 [Flavobacteriales bacterium 34_180_T64]|nr:hypothetical protein A9Q87_07895 [Flavobacteriales bacterium 34_180_T64]